MKVEFLVTIRCSPESKQDAIQTFAPAYAILREQIEKGVNSGLPLAIPNSANLRIRWLLNTPRFE